MATLGIDIGGSRVKAVVWDGGETRRMTSEPYERPDEAALRAAVMACVRQHAGAVRGVGLAVPGVLSGDRRRVKAAANLPGLEGVDLASLVGKPVTVVTSDAIAAATDFAASRQLRGRLLAISLGTGVGAAVLDVGDDTPMGRPLQVDGDSPGHLGQIDVSLSDHRPIGPDGGAGGVEAYLGRDALQGKDLASLRPDDPPMLALVRLLRISHALYRPHHIALLGGVGRQLRHLAGDLLQRTSDHLTSLARPGWTLDFGDDAFHAARGAARLAAMSIGAKHEDRRAVD